jgi:hypothetical protein
LGIFAAVSFVWITITGGLSAHAALSETESVSAAASQIAGISAAPADPGLAQRVVRGWEIQSARAIRRPNISQLTPGYQGRRPSAEERRSVAAKRGGYVIVEVQCKWATLQPPNEPLWVGKPKVALVDEQGQEYPAVDALTRRAGEYVTVGMITNPARRDTRTQRSRSYRLLAYFDVPSTVRTFSLRFPDGGPVIPVEQLGNLPDALVDLPD